MANGKETVNRAYEENYAAFSLSKGLEGEVEDRVARVSKYSSLASLAIAGLSSFWVIDAIKRDKVDMTEVTAKVGLGVAALGGAVHLRSSKKIFDYMRDVNSGYGLGDEEADKIERNGKIGKWSHLVASSSLMITTGAWAAASFSDRPILSGAMLTTLPFWYVGVVKGYGAFYKAAVDYTLGRKIK